MALGALAAAPQIVATALWIPQTNRAVLGMTLADSVFFSIHPLRLLELVVPYPFGDAWEMASDVMWGWPLFRGRPSGIFATLYCGAFAVIAVVATWGARERAPGSGASYSSWHWRSRCRRASCPAGWTADIASPLPLRNPEKLAVALVLALAVLAAHRGSTRSGESRRRRHWPLVVGVVLAGAARSPRPSTRRRRRVWRSGGDRRGSPARARRRAEASLSPRLAEAGLLWMVTVVAVGRLWRGNEASAGRRARPPDGRPDRGQPQDRASFREEEVLGPDGLRPVLPRSDPEGELPDARRGPASRPPSALAARVERRDACSTRISAAARGPSTRRYSGTGAPWSTRTSTSATSRASRACGKVAGLASGFTDSGALFGSLALRWGIRFADQGPIAGYHRIARTRSRLGRARGGRFRTSACSSAGGRSRAPCRP